ncbi:UDP-N-acetylmuramoyl-tripeptide--D-alanyl-D-alanine ligase [Cetobacterium somerae]|uniref:UDP-N-acetylmuramoyl-tripeptide--D-alanyl-D- alanine ligase n=1 Tax=Cetobacterium sp. NK01 TaxID=2993530 RepID=UPI002115EDAE|nr:UDP-N-acetylmuramoyl-tripeptide--D-alanyl-D-alanine ligase [Cetobacterium sp. NK01]MCQ8212322.1 UDP-N-acetylmuramoyl-tripeptide--D-alanyl-D-alanine ligase [Cetobacterium sp. NK01]
MVKYEANIKKGDVELKVFTKVLSDYFQKLKISVPKELSIKNVQMDSKKVEKGSLFIAINNGNNYIEEALEKGAELIICDKDLDIINSKIIKVSNSIKFLQDIAKIYRENLNIKIIAVTGSEGKTTTKDLIFGVLSHKYKAKKTLGNYNNQIGLPFSILQLDEKDEVAVLEMGMSNLGEIDLLSKISKPDYAIITNIGDSHLEFLINRDNVFKAKTEVLKYLNKNHVLVYGDDPYLKNLDTLKVGFDLKSNFKISDEVEVYEGVHFRLNDEKYFVPLNGLYNAVNASFAISIGKLLGMSYQEIKQSLEKIKITSMRFEKIEKDGILFINDAYNASPVSMEMALKAFSSLPLSRKKIIVLGDALELGEKEIEYHKIILLEALRHSFDKIFIYGQRMKKASEILNNSKITYFAEKSIIRDELNKMENIAVLLKGSRGMKLEEIIM